MNNLNLKNFFWSLFKRLANLNLSLFILFLIVIACVIGSILEQEQDISYYTLNYLNYVSLILLLGLDHIFRTWWFISFLLLLCITLVACTFSTQLPSLKNARRWKFIYSQKQSSSAHKISSYNISYYSSINIIYSLMHSSFFVFCRTSSIYAYKGLYGRVAPIFVHFSILAILFGSIYGFFCSFVLQEMVPTGEIFHLKNLVYSGFYSKLYDNLFGHVDDFYIQYYNNGAVKQFFSQLSLYFKVPRLNVSRLMYVNRPLTFNGITFYQTDWELNSLRIYLNHMYSFQQNLVKKVNNGQVFWISSLQIAKNKKVLFILTGLNDTVLVCDDSGLVLKEISLGQEFYLNSTPCYIKNIISSTGLQIKYDPSILLVYFGFFIMIMTTFLSYLSYSQVWIYCSTTFVEFVGSTNRAILFFEQDILLVNQIYNFYSNFNMDMLSKNIYLLR